MRSLNQRILSAYAQMSWLLCNFTWTVACHQRFTSNYNERDLLESHFSCWANPPNISIKVKGNLNNGKTLHLSKLQRLRESHKSAHANVWHLWYSKRIFSAPLLSHCHKLQPPTKRHDSASYLFTVNNECGARLMFPGNEYRTRQAYITTPTILQQKTATPDHRPSASPRKAQGSCSPEALPPEETSQYLPTSLRMESSWKFQSQMLLRQWSASQKHPPLTSPPIFHAPASAMPLLLLLQFAHVWLAQGFPHETLKMWWGLAVPNKWRILFLGPLTEPGMLLAFFVTKVQCWLMFSLLSSKIQVLLCFLDSHLQPVPLCEVIPSQEQGLAFISAELLELPVRLFLQSAEVPLESSPALQCTDCVPQLGNICGVESYNPLTHVASRILWEAAAKALPESMHATSAFPLSTQLVIQEDLLYHLPMTEVRPPGPSWKRLWHLCFPSPF